MRWEWVEPKIAGLGVETVHSRAVRLWLRPAGCPPQLTVRDHLHHCHLPATSLTSCRSCDAPPTPAGQLVFYRRWRLSCPLTYQASDRWRLMSSDLPGQWQMETSCPLTYQACDRWRLSRPLTFQASDRWRLPCPLTYQASDRWRLPCPLTYQASDRCRLISSDLPDQWQMETPMSSDLPGQWQM